MWYSGLVLGSLALHRYLFYFNFFVLWEHHWRDSHHLGLWGMAMPKKKVSSNFLGECLFLRSILAETAQILQAFPDILCGSAASHHTCNGEARWYLLTLGHLPPESTVLHGWSDRRVGCWPLALPDSLLLLLPSHLASGWQRVLQLPISRAAQQMEKCSLQVAQWCEPLPGSLTALRESLNFLFAYVSWVGKDPLSSLSFRNFQILLICFLTEIKKEG